MGIPASKIHVRLNESWINGFDTNKNKKGKTKRIKTLNISTGSQSESFPKGCFPINKPRENSTTAVTELAKISSPLMTISGSLI